MYGIIATWRMALEGVTRADQMLKDHADAGDAIEAAIRDVEDFEYYKSVGYGGLPNEEMQVELDAAYMDGDTFDIGCVAAIKRLRQPRYPSPGSCPRNRSTTSLLAPAPKIRP